MRINPTFAMHEKDTAGTGASDVNSVTMRVPCLSEHRRSIGKVGDATAAQIYKRISNGHATHR